jgi:hypothetical protein
MRTKLQSPVKNVVPINEGSFSMSATVSQSICPQCGLTARPGSAVVVEFGKGGRVHLGCLQNAHRPVPIDNSRPADLRSPSCVNPMNALERL